MSGELIKLILEAMAIYLLVLWTHSLRHRVGLAPFYVFLGGLTAIMSWVTDAGVVVHVAGVTFVVGSTVFYTSLLLGVFVLYVFDGSRAARVAIALVAGMSVLTPLVAAVLHVDGGPLAGIPMPSLRINIASVATTIVDLLFLALAWEFLGNPFLKLKLWGRAFLTLLGVMCLDVVLFSTGAFAGTPDYLRIMGGTFTTRVVVSVFASLFLYVYLKTESRRCDEQMAPRPMLTILREMEGVKAELLSVREQLALKEELLLAQSLSQATLDALSDRIVIVDQEGIVKSANRAWIDFCKSSGLLDSDDVTGLNYFRLVETASGLVDSDSVPSFCQGVRTVLSGEKERYEQAYKITDKNRLLRFVGRVVPLGNGGSRRAVISHIDQSAEDLANRRNKLLNDIFKRLNARGDMEGMLRETVALIREHTGIEAVGLRLRKGNDYPYFVTEGFSESFLEKENFLCVHRPDGSLVLDEQGLPVVECMCGRVIRGETACPSLFSVENGSFWTNRMSEIFSAPTGQALSGNVRTSCRDEGYESVAMVPLKAGTDLVGLLQLDDPRPDLYTEDRIRFFEELGVAIGVEVQQARLKEELRRSEESLRHVISAIRDGLWDWDIVNDQVVCSPQWYRMLGYEPDAFTLNWAVFEELIFPDDVKNVEEAVRAYFCGESKLYSVEFRLRRQDGEYVWVWARGSLVERSAEGEPARMMGVHVDVNEKHEAQRALRESQARYRQLFDSMHAGFALHEIICDESGAPVDYRFLEVNKAFEQLTGLRADDVTGRTVRDVLPETEPHWIETYGRVALTGEAITVEEFSGPLERYYSVVAYSPTRGQFATVFHDVTKQKEAHREIMKARDAAEESNRAKSRFLANMSHELRTPLNAIIGLSELLVDSPLNEEQAEYIQIISDSGGSLLHIISDLLDLSKMDLKQVKVELTEVPVRDVVRKSGALLKSAAEQKGLELTFSVDEDVPENVLADSERLQQVFVNLLSNAVKFTDQGFVRVQVQSRVTPAGSIQVECVVEDSGAGMSAEALGRIFLPFQQGDNSSTRQHGGSGLGLAISKNLVEMMHGELTVESLPGKGSTFRLTLKTSDKDAHSEDVASDLSGWKGKAVCVVSDDPRDLHVLDHLLERHGVIPRYVESVTGALEYLNSGERPDAVFCSLEMDGMRDSLEMLRERTDALWIALSDWSLPLSAEEKTFFKAFLDRPIRPSQLISVLNRLHLTETE